MLCIYGICTAYNIQCQVCVRCHYACTLTILESLVCDDAHDAVVLWLLTQGSTFLILPPPPPQLESLKDSLRTAERAVIQNVYQQKQALYRKEPVLKG